MTSVPVPVALAAALLAAACRGRPEPEQSGPAELPAVLAVDSAFAAAVNAGDVEGIARTYDDDGWLLPPQALPVRGKEGIRGFWGGFLRSYYVHLKFGVDRFEVRMDRAYIVGHYRMETTPKSADVPTLAPENGKFLEVLKRRPDGTWSYLVDMYSANAPPQ
jgi:uncharacterized protein (TIGR02246 family)